MDTKIETAVKWIIEELGGTLTARLGNTCSCRMYRDFLVNGRHLSNPLRLLMIMVVEKDIFSIYV